MTSQHLTSSHRMWLNHINCLPPWQLFKFLLTCWNFNTNPPNTCYIYLHILKHWCETADIFRRNRTAPVVLTYKLLFFTTNYGISIWYHTTRNKTLMYPTHYPEMIMSVNIRFRCPALMSLFNLIYTQTPWQDTNYTRKLLKLHSYGPCYRYNQPHTPVSLITSIADEH